MKPRRQLSLRSHVSEFLRGMVLLKYGDSPSSEELHAPKAYIVLETLTDNLPDVTEGQGLRVTVADPCFRIEALLTDQRCVEALRCRNRIRKCRGGFCCWTVYIMSNRMQVESDRVYMIIDAITALSDNHNLVNDVQALSELSQDEEIARLLRGERISVSQAISVLNHSDSNASFITANSPPNTTKPPGKRPNSRKKNESSSSDSDSSSSGSSDSSSSGSSSSSSDDSEGTFRTAVSNFQREAPLRLVQCAFKGGAATEGDAVTMAELRIPPDALDVLANLPSNLDSLDLSGFDVQPSSSSSALAVSSLSLTAFSQQSLGLEASQQLQRFSPKKHGKRQDPSDSPTRKCRRIDEEDRNEQTRIASPGKGKQVTFQSSEKIVSPNKAQEIPSSCNQKACSHSIGATLTVKLTRIPVQIPTETSPTAQKTASPKKDKEVASSSEEKENDSRRSREPSPQTPEKSTRQTSRSRDPSPKTPQRSTMQTSRSRDPSPKTPQNSKSKSRDPSPKTPEKSTRQTSRSREPSPKTPQRSTRQTSRSRDPSHKTPEKSKSRSRDPSPKTPQRLRRSWSDDSSVSSDFVSPGKRHQMSRVLTEFQTPTRRSVRLSGKGQDTGSSLLTEENSVAAAQSRHPQSQSPEREQDTGYEAFLRTVQEALWFNSKRHTSPIPSHERMRNVLKKWTLT